VDVKIAGEPGVNAVRPERPDQRAEPEREPAMPPAAIVELGRTPESAGTYTARGVIDRPAPAASARVADGPAPPPQPTERPAGEPLPAASSALPETLRLPANAQLQVISNASPQVAAALRQRLPTAVPDLHHPPASLVSGIQTFAPSALKQAEKHEDVAEHEDDLDPMGKEDKEAPPPRAGQRHRA
jgi:hypothetical protein